MAHSLSPTQSLTNVYKQKVHSLSEILLSGNFLSVKKTVIFILPHLLIARFVFLEPDIYIFFFPEFFALDIAF